MNSPQLHILTVVSVPFEENAYVVHRAGDHRCLVVDPGLEPERIVEELEANKLTPEAILNTHGHADHIAGNALLKQHWPNCPILIGEADAEKLTDSQQNLSATFGFAVLSPPADLQLTDGQHYSAAGIDIEARWVPGHSAGHMVYLIEEATPAVAFVGDVIFRGSVGRTDLPDGDFRTLADGIRAKLYQLPNSVQLFPGHGLATTVGREKAQNPFVSGE